MTAIPGKLPAFGTLLKCNLLAGDNASTWRDVAFVRAIKGPPLALDTADTTAHDSTAAWEEVVPTILRSGEVSIDLVYDPADVTIEATTAGLVYGMKNKTLYTFKIYFPTDTVEASRKIWTLPGYVTAFEPDAPHDGALTASLKFKITGQPTLV
jgi:hypothetical protein